MPVDTTRVVSSRRTQKKLTEEELQDIDCKRLRGELSCAECRRLKLRCDKKLPCGSCYRRGCESICPLGILAAGQGTRFILADTDQLHEKIYEMSNRIRQLEDALAILQSTVSDQRHPLLADDLLKIKFGSEALNARQPQNSDEDSATNKSIDALGTLTLGSSGEVQYFGRSAGSETLMMKAGEEEEGSSDDDQDSMQAPLDMLLEVEQLANLFPFSSKNRPNLSGLELVEAFLPSHERATQLCHSYIKHATYFFRPIKSDDLLDGLFPAIYNAIIARREATASGSDSDESIHVDGSAPHALATLYFIFALGALLDLTRMPFNSEAERYYDLGRAALSLRAVYESPNMDSVQAMGLMATYHSLAGKKYSRDSAWCVMSFAAKLAQSIGLHRDSARWNMDIKTVQERRNLFWEVFSADVSHSLALGRPPAIHLSYVDCEFPLDDDASLSSDSEHQSGFWRMKHTFARDIYNSVAEATLIARAPSYNIILDLDRKVREVSFPASFNPYVTKEVGPEIFHSSSLCLRDFYASQHRTVTMIYLHRSFFAQAMLDHPTNPLLSPFAPSFLTAYRSASVIIKASAHLFERCAPMGMRVWFLMYHTFSAAIIVGTVVTRSPNSSIASIAMRDFNLALSLFERTAAQSQRAKIALGVILKLKEKANRAYEQYGNSLGPADPSSPRAQSQFVLAVEDIEDDLAIFGGQLRVLDRKGKQPHQRSPSSLSGSSSSSSGVTTAAPGAAGDTSPRATGIMGSPQTQPSSSPSACASPTETSNQGVVGLGLGLELPDVHPSLVAYLNQDAVRRAMGQSWHTTAPISISIPPAEGQGEECPSRTAPPMERLNGFETRRGVEEQGYGYWDSGYSGWQDASGSHLDAYLASGPTSDEVEEEDDGEVEDSRRRRMQPPVERQNQYLFFADPSREWGPTNANTNTHQEQENPAPSNMGMPPYGASNESRGSAVADNLHFTPVSPVHGPHLSSSLYSKPQAAQNFDFNVQLMQHMGHDLPGNVSSELPGYHGRHDAGGSGTDFGHYTNYGYPAVHQAEYGNMDMCGMGMSAGGGHPFGAGFMLGTRPIAMDHAGVIDMGLSSESGMDAGWVSFMRDCGIMDMEE